MPHANIKIVSDGTIAGTKVVDAKTGEMIAGYVVGVDWSATLSADKKEMPVYATITFENPELDVSVNGDDVSEIQVAPLPSLGDG